MTAEAPELSAAKLWRDVIRRRHIMEDAAEGDRAVAEVAYAAALAAYREVKEGAL